MEASKQKTGRLKHFIRHIEEVGRGRFEASILTEDGHRLSGFSAIAQQAVEDVHEKAQTYGNYDFPNYCKALPVHEGGEAA